MTSLTQTCDVGLAIPRHVHVFDGRKSHEFVNNTEWQPPERSQNGRYASSGVSVLISFARVSMVSVNSPFLQSHRQRKTEIYYIPRKLFHLNCIGENIQ